MNRPIYLDHNATTPLDEEVKAEMVRSLEVFGNPSSIHAYGLASKALIEKARLSIASLLNCSASEIILTSGGTEANNLAIFGIAEKRRTGHIISSSIEHPAVSSPLRRLQEYGFKVTHIPVGSNGIVDPNDLKKAICRDTFLITIMHANNETGMIQPIREIGMIAREHGIILHSDASQSVGKIETDVQEMLVDMLTIAGHKFYAPKGVGALYLREGLSIEPFMLGAGHEKGLRPGTENITGIAGLGKACELVKRDMHKRITHNAALVDIIYNTLNAGLSIRLNGSFVNKLPNTLNISISGASGNELVSKVKERVAISAGSACHAGLCKPSTVLKAMGLSDQDALSALRISTGKDNTVDEVREASDYLLQTVN